MINYFYLLYLFIYLFIFFFLISKNWTKKCKKIAGKNERNLKHRVTTFLDHNFQTYYILHKIKNIKSNLS